MQKVTDVSVGEYHMVALTDSGNVYTWGKDRAPQLGHTNAQQGYPNAVELPGGARATRVAAGRQQTCAVSKDGEVYTWGIGFEGALGHFRASCKNILGQLGGSFCPNLGSILKALEGI